MSIVFTGGGTIGPTTSLVPIIKEIQKHSKITCHFIAPRGSQGREIIEALGVTWTEIPAGKLARYPSFSWLTVVPNVLRGYIAAGKILKERKVKVVVTSGSFVGPPVIWRARRMGIQNVVIQMDIQLGFANRLSFPFADTHLFSYGTQNRTKQSELIGPVMRNHHVNKNNVSDLTSIDPRKPIIFVTGGGTGADQINELIWQLAEDLSKRVVIIHSTGKGKVNSNIAFKNYIQKPFFQPDEYFHWLSKSSVVVGRSGMGFLSDVIEYKKAVIAIPIPKTHQVKNANFFAKHNAVIIPLNSQEVTTEWLLQNIDELLSQVVKRSALERTLGSFAKKKCITSYCKNTSTIA